MQPTDDQLNDLLKQARVPERDPGYWEFFPARVVRQLGGSASTPTLLASVPRRQPALLWSLLTATAIAVILLTVLVWQRVATPPPQLHAELPDPSKVYREMVALFPDRLQAIIADAHGIRVVLADEPSKPASAPLFVKACARNGCREIITFSGQQIRVNGETWDVLLTGQNQVIVTGRSTAKYHIESRRLGGVS